MEQSILTSTKKILGLAANYSAFDHDIIVHINSVFSTLTQLGIGPADGFRIEDDSVVWSDFLANDIQLDSVRTYVYLRVRLLFDPPTTSYLIAAYEKQIEEITWRLSVHREDLDWVDPNPRRTFEEDPEIIEGGIV